MADAPEVRYARATDGVHVAYSVFGDGPIDLVFLPGMASHVDWMWEWPGAARLFERLAEFARVILVDRRGVGLSDRSIESFVIEDVLLDIDAVCDALDLDLVSVMGGHDAGAASLLYAARRPERVSAIATFGSRPRFLTDDDWPFGTAPELLDEIIEQADRDPVFDAARPEIISPVAPSVAYDPRFQQWNRRLWRLAVGPGGWIKLLRAYAHIDLRHVLDLVQCPVLVLHRSGDCLSSVEHGRHLAAQLPHGQLSELPGEDGLIYVGDVDVVADEVAEFLTGARPDVNPDRILATLLFTDTVGSTAVVGSLGDRAAAKVWDDLESLTAREAEQRRGRVVKHLGDGSLAVFDGPAAAIRAAQAIHQGAAALGLTLRSAVHTGEVEARGEDVGGIAVHIAARVSDQARPSEVLVSRTVTDLVAGSGLAFADRGEHELRGVPGRWALFAVQD